MCLSLTFSYDVDLPVVDSPTFLTAAGDTGGKTMRIPKDTVFVMKEPGLLEFTIHKLKHDDLEHYPISEEIIPGTGKHSHMSIHYTEKFKWFFLIFYHVSASKRPVRLVLPFKQAIEDCNFRGFLQGYPGGTRPLYRNLLPIVKSNGDRYFVSLTDFKVTHLNNYGNGELGLVSYDSNGRETGAISISAINSYFVPEDVGAGGCLETISIDVK